MKALKCDFLIVCLSVCLSQIYPKVSAKPLLMPDWRQIVVHLRTNSCTCLHLEYRVVQLGPNHFCWVIQLPQLQFKNILFLISFPNSLKSMAVAYLWSLENIKVCKSIEDVTGNALTDNDDRWQSWLDRSVHN